MPKRDLAAHALVDAGYKLLRKDAEPPIEAEAHVEGERTDQRSGHLAVRGQAAAALHGLMTP